MNVCRKYKRRIPSYCLARIVLTNLFRVSLFRCYTIPVVNLQQGGGSIALLVASIWTGIIHLGLGVLGTFVLKRFPTSFSVGFLLGVLVVLANQNLIMFVTFSRYSQGSPRTNHIFASLGLTLFAVLTFMALLLLHFKQDVVVTPMDVNGNKEDEEFAVADAASPRSEPKST
jgi:hypothetical protein